MAIGGNGSPNSRAREVRTRLAVGAVVALTAMLVVGAQPASAGTAIAVVPDFPSPVTVGQAGIPASVTVHNVSTGAQATGNITVDSITLVPSCAVFDTLCSGNADPNTVTLSATGVGAPGTNCEGRTFDVVVNTATTGRVAFNPVGGPILLGPPNPDHALDTCRIDFTFRVRRVPNHDSQATSGIQTNQVAGATARHPDGTLASAAGSVAMTVTPASPTIVTRATPRAPIGRPISDFAVITGVSNGPPVTGTVTFTLYGPNDASCLGTPAFTSTITVASVVPSAPPEAIASSGSFAPTALGTHRWVATYSGDRNYSAVTSPCNAPREISVITTPESVGVFRPSSGHWFISNGPTVQWGTSGDIAVPADYNGDGSQDIAVFRPSSGVWFVRDGAIVAFGADGDVPVPGDYDGDGDDDMAVFRPSVGVWFVQGGPTVQFGTNGDVPVPADYDRDGDDDMAVFRPSAGVWFVRDGETVAFGTIGDIPVPADYDGDRDDDMAVFRPASGVWLIRNGPTTAFGTSGDVPVPGDYDGDGDDDIAVFRPSAGVWFFSDRTAVAFGTSGDDPLPLPAAVRERFFP